MGGPQLIQQFLTTGTLNSGAKSGYAFGVDIQTYKGLRAFGHDGVYNGYSAATMQFHDQKFSVVCLCNLMNIPSAFLARQVSDIYLAGVKGKQGCPS